MYYEENRISVVRKANNGCNDSNSGDDSDVWTYTYDGDGVRVKEVYAGTGTLTKYYFAGGMYEVQDDGTTTTIRVYYSITGMRVAMEEDDGTTQTVYYFVNDHLSSASVVTDASGTLLSENRYTPFGEVRDLPASMSTDDPITETDFGYTGQRDLGDIGLMDYNARFYSPTLRRFIQPDTIIPGAGNPQSFNRFSYVGNNPISFVDPTGHIAEGENGEPCLPSSNCPERNKPPQTDSNSDVDNMLYAITNCPDSDCLELANIYLNYVFSDWQIQVLLALYDTGPDGLWAVSYIYHNQVEITFSDQSGTGAAWSLEDYLNGNQVIYITSKYNEETILKSAWALSGVAHEAKHLEQGPIVALSIFGELEAWQLGLRVNIALGGSTTIFQRKILNLPLGHDPVVLAKAKYYFFRDQGFDYLAYLLPLQPGGPFYYLSQ